MTAPTEDEVRAWLEGALIVNDMRARMGGDDSGHFYRAALALLDEARKDRARLDGLAYDMEGSPVFDQIGAHDIHEIASADPGVEVNERDAYCRAFRAAIDQARGEG